VATLVTYLIKRSWREKADGSSTRSLLTSFHVGRIIYTDIRPATGLRPVGKRLCLKSQHLYFVSSEQEQLTARKLNFERLARFVDSLGVRSEGQYTPTATPGLATAPCA